MIAVLLATGAIAAFWGMLQVARREQRRKCYAAPFPDDWVEILNRNLPPYAALSGEERQRLHGTIQVLLGTKHFEGCGGLELTDEIRVTIAAHACMLLLNRNTAVYPRLKTVLVYPSTYIAGKKGLFNDEKPDSVRLGESWTSGVVVLAWNSVKGGAVNFDDGQNVTVHEFAHQLDQEDGTADGAPTLEDRSSYRSWARVLAGEYKALCKRTRKGRRTVMNPYGATNPAEFFAVATETFFEKPQQMQKKHAELYEELKRYYKTDPLTWE
jgi:Mlc titration factor MtfA (ptsG expression regulator)